MTFQVKLQDSKQLLSAQSVSLLIPSMSEVKFATDTDAYFARLSCPPPPCCMDRAVARDSSLLRRGAVFLLLFPPQGDILYTSLLIPTASYMIFDGVGQFLQGLPNTFFLNKHKHNKKVL